VPQQVTELGRSPLGQPGRRSGTYVVDLDEPQRLVERLKDVIAILPPATDGDLVDDPSVDLRNEGADWVLVPFDVVVVLVAAPASADRRAQAP
jgi:hypothetical protein